METPTLPESAGVCGQSSDSADILRTSKLALVRHCNKCLSVTAFDLDVTCANAKALKWKGQTVRIVSADEFEKVQLQQCHCGEQPAPDFGEPWTKDHRFGMAQNRDGKCLSVEQEFRAVECVNACAGMVDPAKEITHLRDYAYRTHELATKVSIVVAQREAKQEELEAMRDELADIRQRLKGHPDSQLAGENGLAAATMRGFEIQERQLEAMREAIKEAYSRLQALNNAPWLTRPDIAGDEIEHLLAKLQPFITTP